MAYALVFKTHEGSVWGGSKGSRKGVERSDSRSRKVWP